MIFITDIDPMLDKNVRLAANHADRQEGDRRPAAAAATACRSRRWRRRDMPPSIPRSRSPTIRSWPRACSPSSGYSPEKPVKFTIQTTRGFKPKDYEMIQAIVGMWRKVGIEANIEVYEIAKHFELRAAPQAGAGRLLQLGQRDRRSHRPRPALRCSARRRIRPGRARISIEQDRPAVGREGRGQAHRRLEGGRQIHRRGGRGDPAAPIRAADHLQEGPQGRGASPTA